MRDLGRTPPPAPDELPEGVTDHAGRGVGLRPGYDLLRLVDLWARLVGRLTGPSPGVRCGASAAYDAQVVGVLVDWVELRS